MSAQRIGKTAVRPDTAPAAEAAMNVESDAPYIATCFAPTPPGLATGPVRRSGIGADVLGGTPVPTATLDILRRRHGFGQPLPDQIATPMGEQLGVDLSAVRVHSDGEANAVAQSLQARAFTVGSDIYFDRGAYRPGSLAGQRVLAHELAHVAQQAGGAAGGSAPVVGRADDPVEAQADRLADTALRRLRTAESRRVSAPTRPTEAINRMAVLRKLSATAGQATPRSGQRPTGSGLRSGPRSGVIRRSPTYESMDAAWGEMTAEVDGLNMVSFVERLRRLRRVPDGNKGFTWDEFVAVIGTERGKKFVTDKWRDKPGAEWGEDQTIQGQHEWIKTDAIAYVIRTVVLDHGGKLLDQWLAACDMLRIPTSDVLLTPTISPALISDVNEDPDTYTMSGIGGFNGHVGALYKAPATPKKDPIKNAYSALTKGGAGGLHNPMHQLLTTNLNAKKNDLQGFLTAISAYQTDKVWGGVIPGLDESAARQVPNDLRGGQTASALLYGSYQSTFTQGAGVSTTFTEAGSLYDVQQIAKEAKERNRGIMQHRANALVQMIKPTTIAPSSQWGSEIPQPGYVVDSAGKTTEDYDAEAGYNSMAVEPNPHAPYDPIGDDTEPDEEYSLAAPKPNPRPTGAPGHFPQKLLDEFGQIRSNLQKEQETKIQKINAEVNALFAAAYQSETSLLKKRVEDALAQIHPADPEALTKRAAINQQAARDLKGIDDKYQAEGRRHFNQYIDQKRQRDVRLFTEHPQQVTHETLDALLVAYMQDTNRLLDAYVADIKKTLNIT